VPDLAAALFDNVASMDVDPRGIAQRIMDVSKGHASAVALQQDCSQVMLQIHLLAGVQSLIALLMPCDP
jgi:hypothetical protein